MLIPIKQMRKARPHAAPYHPSRFQEARADPATKPVTEAVQQGVYILELNEGPAASQIKIAKLEAERTVRRERLQVSTNVVPLQPLVPTARCALVAS
jgi:hypothetical protein